IDDRAKELYEDSRDIGWYVYSDVSMEEVQELAAVKSKGKHINALKKLKKARKATDEDNFNFFGRDERIQDVAKAKPADGFASSGIFMDDGIWLMRRGNRDFLSEEFSSREYRDAMSGLDKVRFGSDKELTTQESRAIRKLANLYLEKPSTRSPQRQAIADIVNMVNDYRPGRGSSDGFASRFGPLKPRTPGKRIGVEPRYQDRDWVNQTQERILAQNLDFTSLSEDDQIDWVNSMLGDYLDQNDMGYDLADLANGRRLNTRPDMDLLNYAEQAYARMSDAHMGRRAQYGDQDGFASVGRRTRRLGIKPSQAVDYVSYDPESESLFVAYKREDGRGDMYVYEGVSMDDAIGVENAESVGRAINDIKRRKNVRKATPEEVVGLSNADNMEKLRTIDSAMRSKKLDIVQQSIHSDDRFGLGKRESRIDEDGRLVIAEGSEAEGEQRLVVDWNPATGRFEVSVERWSSGDDVTPSGWETARSLTPFFDDGNGSIVREELLELNRQRELELDSEARIERELDDARRELDMAGDAPGVESVDVTYSSALDAVDYNPSTQELRVT
ncbi:MAG: KTSC domain-containing protein, partial [Gammaproteobacteria bacterium]|nr:KTSC domain-containing protein [Gammaproteobacteria bacterium]